jgi:Glycosyltransferase family 87
MKEIKEWIRSGNFLFDRKLALVLWFGLPVADLFYSLLFHPKINNFLVFKQVYYHAIAARNLYASYPLEYGDVNLYGPVFSLVIAPFALLPTYGGLFLWVLFNAGILYFAILKLPVQQGWKTAILILSSNEMLNNSSWLQSNPFIAACIILGFVYSRQGKNAPALFFILLASFIKLYGIVGLIFFIFSPRKLSFVSWAITWSIVFFVLPFIIANPAFIVHSYFDWYQAIVHKDLKNVNMAIQNDFQDISAMGLIRRIFNWPAFKTIWMLVPASIFFLFQFRFKQHLQDLRFQLYTLCLAGIGVVIFSTSSESPTYIIAFPLVCLWFLMQEPSRFTNTVFVTAILLTCYSYSDLFTPYFRIYLARPYAIKALPCCFIWCLMLYQVYTKKYLTMNLNRRRLTN